MQTTAQCAVFLVQTTAQIDLCNCPMPNCPFSERPVNQVVCLCSLISKFQNLKYQNILHKAWGRTLIVKVQNLKILLKRFLTSLLENCFLALTYNAPCHTANHPQSVSLICSQYHPQSDYQ